MLQRKVMVIGVDAATLDLVRPWAGEGRLPNFQRFLENAACPLRSTVPMVSAAAWSTFATGLNPGKHGIIDFCQLEPDRYEARFVNARHRHGATFWEIAGQAGIRGGIINVPVTYPPRPYNGFIVSGVLSPSPNRKMTSPPELFDELMEACPDYAIDANVANTSGRDVRLLFLQRSLACIKTRQQAAVALYRKHRPPLFCVVFTITDRLCHYFWRYLELNRAGRHTSETEKLLGESIFAAYSKIDEAIGALVDVAGDDTDVFILSDHGSGPRSGGINMRNLLLQHGLLTKIRSGLLRRTIRRTINTVARSAPTSLKSWAKTRLAATTSRAASSVACGGIDFSRTQAYPVGEAAGLFVNLKGRQPQGIVEPGAEYEAVRDRLIDILSNLTDPDTNRPIASKVHRREEIWSGPYVKRLPDVVMEQEVKHYDTRLNPEVENEDIFYSLDGLEPTSLYHSGQHTRNGLLMAMGPHIRRCPELPQADIADVPATILALTGCEIPECFDGRVLTEMLTDDVEIPGRRSGGADDGDDQEVFSEEEKAIVEERLKGLGYL
ncbi:MAG: alkaline phosphatase family protein [Planctomycetota bacterium]|nr:alkaline phosphatase family protein [Planctomycetota bacterium]